MMQSVCSQARTVEADNSIPLRHYYRIAGHLLYQAKVYREENNIVDLYIVLLRFSSLVSETIPRHRDYKTYKGKEKSSYKEVLQQVLIELEYLKPILQCQKFEPGEKQRRQQSDQHSQEGESSVCHEKESDTFSYAYNDKCSRSKQSQNAATISSLYVCEPKEETLRKHSILSSDILHAKQKTTTGLKVEYPANVGSTSLHMPGSCEEDGLSYMSSYDALNSNYHFQFARQPPLPVTCVVQSLPSELSFQTEHFENTSVPEIPSSATLNDDHSLSSNLKYVQISPKMMDDFLKIAQSNTVKNLETCGVLAGTLKRQIFYVTTLIIPKQQSTSDSCDTISEAEICSIQDEKSLLTLGWIHTHPSQSCFMSSIDLHTQYSYQLMLPEAIAIVMAPTDPERFGIFHLTDPKGIKVLRQCQQHGFHLHEDTDDGVPIYDRCKHVLMNPNLKFDIIDVRQHYDQ